SASGLPPLWHRPRPLLSLQKAGASSTHSKPWRDVPNVSEFREAFGVRPACRRFGIAPDHCCPSEKREQAPRTPNAGATCQMSPSSAKRLDCVRLAGALASPATTAVPPKSGSKLRALQTLARRAKCLRVPRSVWTASGLPALWHRPRPLLSLQKAGASSAHSKRWRDVPNVSEFREAFGVRPACRRFGIARGHCSPSKKRSKLPHSKRFAASKTLTQRIHRRHEPAPATLTGKLQPEASPCERSCQRGATQRLASRPGPPAQRARHLLHHRRHATQTASVRHTRQARLAGTNAVVAVKGSRLATRSLGRALEPLPLRGARPTRLDTHEGISAGTAFAFCH